MTLPELIIPILMAATTLLAATPATDSPAATSPVVAAPVADSAPPAKLEFPLAGYRIDAFDPAPKEGFHFTMSLPVPGKNSSFSVKVTSFAMEKAKPPLPVRFYPHSGYTVLSERRTSPTELRVEFTRKEPGNTTPKEHAYTLEIFVNDTLYDVTAAVPDTDWPAVGAKLKAYVESFEPTPDPAPGKIAFPHQGYRISSLDGAISAGAKQRLLWIFGAGRDMAVSIEPYTKTLKDYQAERKPPVLFDSPDKFKVMEEYAPAENALVAVYVQEFPTDKNHRPIQNVVYEKVVLAHGQLYRASGLLPSAGDANPKIGAQIKAWVESLEVMPNPAPATTGMAVAAPAATPVPAK